MRRFLRENSLSITMFALCLICLVGQAMAGYRDDQDERQEHQQPVIGLGSYLTSGVWIEAVFENWESEFLQMGAYVFLTVFLRQKGSPESKPLDQDDPVDADPASQPAEPDAPWPVRRGGWVLGVYKHSLTLALLLLFGLSLLLHAFGGTRAYNEEQLIHGGVPVSMVQYLGTARFWFESLQNWQSEFLSVGVLVVLSVFLRQQGSPESKPVASPHHQTGH